MNPVNPWLDPAEVRRLAESLLQPASQTPNFPDAGFDDSFVGFAAGPAAFPSSEPQGLPPARIAAAVVTPQIPQAPAAPPPVMERVTMPQPIPAPVQRVGTWDAAQRGAFLDRIQRFRDWLHEQFSASGVFILDREGAVLFDESGHGKLHFLARSLALTTRRPGSTNVHIKVGVESVLEVIPVETPYGGLVLGAVLPSPLSPPAASAVMEALKLVASPPSSQVA
jgi:hypothetical protein